MPIVELGDQAGKAAPGEYGPRALLNHRGAIIIRDSTGLPVEHQLGAAGTFLGSDGTDLLDRKPPGYLLARDAGAAPQNATLASEVTVLTGVLANALPAFAAGGDAVQLRVWGITVLNTSGNQTFNVYAGATKIAAGTPSGAITNARGWLLDLWIHLLSSTTVSVSGLMIPRGPAAAGFGTASDVFVAGNDAGTAVAISALPQNIDVKVLTSTNATTSTVTCKGAEARYYPKNY